MITPTESSVERARSVIRAFSPGRLTMARQVAGMTKRQLAEAIGKTATSVTQFELGQARPSADTLAALAETLKVPVPFFAAGRPQLALDIGSAHFRSLRATRAYQREQALALMALLWEVVQCVEQAVELPAVNLPGWMTFGQFGSPGEAAQALRTEWRLGEGPLPHLLRHAEANGIVASILPQTYAGDLAAGSPDHPSGVGNVDAFSTRESHRPLIGLTGSKGGLLRRRFNVAHEIGHLLLHSEARPGDAQHEREAHLFAAELMLPRDAMLDELPVRPDPAKLVPLQQRWGASVSALGYRGKTLGKYSDSQLRRLMISLSQLGWRTNEPEDARLLAGEEPVLLKQAVELAAPLGISVSSISEELALPVPLVRSLLGMPDHKPRLTLLDAPP